RPRATSTGARRRTAWRDRDVDSDRGGVGGRRARADRVVLHRQEPVAGRRRQRPVARFGVRPVLPPRRPARRPRRGGDAQRDHDRPRRRRCAAEPLIVLLGRAPTPRPDRGAAARSGRRAPRAASAPTRGGSPARTRARTPPCAGLRSRTAARPPMPTPARTPPPL